MSKDKPVILPPPSVISIDITPAQYLRYKDDTLKKQHRVVRSYLREYINWLKGLEALDVYDALEKGETVREKYNQMKFNPIRVTVAASRGLLKRNTPLREKANKALSIELARLVLRFENPAVWQVLREFDPQEEFLRRNIQATKEIFGLVEIAAS